MSMDCPKCNAPARIYNTRRTQYGTWRRYRCTKTKKHTFTGIEFITRFGQHSGVRLRDELNDRLTAEARLELKGKLVEAIEAVLTGPAAGESK